MNDQEIKTKAIHDLLFFLKGIQKLDVHVFLQNHAWMGEKGEHGWFKVGVFGTIYEAFQYLTVPNMHAIKRANGNYCLKGKVFKMRDVMDCFQRLKK